MDTLQEMIGQNLPVFWIASVITAVLGLLACFMGYRLKKFWVGFIGFGAGFLAGFLVSRIFLESIWLCIGIGGLCAVILAVLAFCFYRAGVFLMCAVLMFFVIKVLLHGEEWWIYLISALAGIAAGVAGICFVKQMLTAVTGVFGAYFAVQAVWNMAGLESVILRGAAVVLLAVCGITVQFHFSGRREHAEEKKNIEKQERAASALSSAGQRERHERRRQNRENQKGDNREI